MTAVYLLAAFLAWVAMVALIVAFFHGATKGRDHS